MLLSEFITITFQNARSTKRTELLHQAILTEIKKDYPEFDDLNWKFEQRLPDGYNYYMEGGVRKERKTKKGNWVRFFKIDIVGFDKNGIPRVVICVKGLNNNVLQNVFNYCNTSLGESDRLLYGPHENDIQKMIFVTLYPNKTAYFDKNGIVKKIENVAKRMLDTDPSYMLHKKHGNTIKIVKYNYDINELENYTHKSQFEEGITFSNLKKI